MRFNANVFFYYIYAYLFIYLFIYLCILLFYYFLQSFLGFFDANFEDVENPARMSTGPVASPTHWKQTIFYLREPFRVYYGAFGLQILLLFGACGNILPRTLSVF